MNEVQQLGKIESLFSEYPYLRAILGYHDQENFVARITVERIDHKLLHSGLYASFKNISHTNGVWKGKQTRQIMLINEGNYVLDSIFCYMPKLGMKGLFFHHDPENIKAIVVKTEERWYSRVWGFFPRLERVDKRIVVYLPPKNGLWEMVNELDIEVA